MSTNRTVAVSSPRQFARHHWTSLAFLILGLGLFVFIGIAHNAAPRAPFRDIGLFDKHRNKDFQSASEAIPSNILADRLKRMTAYGLLEKRRYQDRPPRYEYHLTRQGRELLPVLRELALWSEKNLAGVKIPRAAKVRILDRDVS